MHVNTVGSLQPSGAQTSCSEEMAGRAWAEDCMEACRRWGLGWDGPMFAAQAIRQHLIAEVTSFATIEAGIEVTLVVRSAAFSAIAS